VLYLLPASRRVTDASVTRETVHTQLQGFEKRLSKSQWQEAVKVIGFTKKPGTIGEAIQTLVYHVMARKGSIERAHAVDVFVTLALQGFVGPRRVAAASERGDFHYVPLLFYRGSGPRGAATPGGTLRAVTLPNPRAGGCGTCPDPRAFHTLSDASVDVTDVGSR
jgi:hypothetical protein